MGLSLDRLRASQEAVTVVTSEEGAGSRSATEQEGNLSSEIIQYHLTIATYTGQTRSVINGLTIQVLLLLSMSA